MMNSLLVIALLERISADEKDIAYITNKMAERGEIERAEVTGDRNYLEYTIKLSNEGYMTYEEWALQHGYDLNLSSGNVLTFTDKDEVTVEFGIEFLTGFQKITRDKWLSEDGEWTVIFHMNDELYLLYNADDEIIDHRTMDVPEDVECFIKFLE